MTSGKVIVFIRTSSTARIPVYKHLQQQGYRLVMMHPGETFDFTSMFEHWIDCETNDVNVLDRELRAAMKEKCFTPSAIISVDEYGVYPAAQLCQRFERRSLPMCPEGLVNTSVKSKFRDWCTTHSIGSPKYASLHSPGDDIDAVLKHMTFPCVVKPSPGAGSMLTTRVGSLEELRGLVPTLWAALQNHPALIHLEALGCKVHLLVEEFVGGQEVDIDVVVENGVVRFCAISDNFEVTPPYFCEQGGLMPSALGPQEQKELRGLLDAFVLSHGTGLHGVLHFEAKYDFERGKPYVIEVNVRPGSAETCTLVHTVYGVCLGECLVRLALDESLDDLGLDRQPICHAASVNIYPENAGMLKEIFLEGMDADESLVVFSSLPEGSNVAPPPISFGLMAWMVARGGCGDTAIYNIQKLTAKVKFGVVCIDSDGHFECCCVENSSLALAFDSSTMKNSFAKAFDGLGNKGSGRVSRQASNSRSDSSYSKTICDCTCCSSTCACRQIQ